jgi:hypothetical protein
MSLYNAQDEAKDLRKILLKRGRMMRHGKPKELQQANLIISLTKRWIPSTFQVYDKVPCKEV